MKTIPKNVLLQLVNQCNKEKISELRVAHWFMLHGANAEKDLTNENYCDIIQKTNEEDASNLNVSEGT